MQRRIYLTKEFEFEAAHKLDGYDGDCANLHGHSYKLQVRVTGGVQDKSSNIAEAMVMDFKEIKRTVKKVLENLDHKYLNDIIEGVPTAELLSIYIYNEINTMLPKDVTIDKVTLWETRDSFVEYMGGVMNV